MFEVSLIRLFSIYLWYHFAFMVISIAMLGTGSAGTLLALSKERYRSVSAKTNLPLFACFGGISIIVSYVISNHIPFDPVKFSWEYKQFIYLAGYCLVLSIPFFFAGILFASAFYLYSSKSGTIYGSDLLGAGAGSLIILLLLNITSPENAVLLSSSLCLTGALISGKIKLRLFSLIFILINVMIFSLQPSFFNINISPYKKLSLALKYPGAEHLNTYYSSYSRIDTFKSPAIRFAPGLSLKYLDPLPDQIGFSVDGDRIDVITDVRDTAKLKFIKHLPASVAYETSQKESVLILDPKGGLHVLMARHYGSGKIYKVESNPMIVSLIRDNFRDFSGGIFDHNTWTGYGRNFLSGQKSPVNGSHKYDLIDLPMTGASVSGISGISEDYRYTVEAFKQYFGALRKNGILSISLYLIPPPRTELRILATIAAALEQSGVKDIADRVAAIRSWDSMTILVKKLAFTNHEINKIKNFSKSMNFDIVYYYGMKAEEYGQYIKTPSDEYFAAFRNILNPETRQLFTDSYLFDINPAYDNKPFFHYYLKIENIKATYDKVGRKWLYFLNEGYLLPLIFLIVLILSTAIIILPVSISSKNKQSVQMKQLKKTKRFEQFFILLYFAMLGLGFMFVEVSLVHRSILLFENPSYSFAVVLTIMLLSSGAGSILSSRYPSLNNPNSLLMIFFLVLLLGLLHPLLLDYLSSFSPEMKILFTSILLFPPGFFMGIPFPAGMKLLGEKSSNLIPWAWAINASLSVIAPVITIMIALVIGFQPVMLLAAGAYLISFASLKKLTSLR
jgi:hypothetical protein